MSKKINFKALERERHLERKYMKNYTPDFLSRIGATANDRTNIIEWMKRVRSLQLTSNGFIAYLDRAISSM